MTSFAPNAVRGKTIVVAVCGGIAAYKVVTLVSRLVQAGAIVEVLMTEAAQHFVNPLTFRALTHRPVHTDAWGMDDEGNIAHISLARRADLLVVAPATAHTIARLAHGLADDIVTLVAIATSASVLLAPAMDGEMFVHPATQANVATLQNRGVTVVGPEAGRLASGLTGMGRMSEPEALFSAICTLFASSSDLAGLRIVVTAGGTQEPIDPVRYIGNASTGKMGYAIAEAAGLRGASVTLITAPSALTPPAQVNVVHVRTAQDLRKAVHDAVPTTDVLIQAAAVSDYRVEQQAVQKIKRGAGELTIRLVENPDIIAEVGALPTRPFLVGFAAETQDGVANAQSKLDRKNLDMIVLNDVSKPGSGFGTDTNEVTVISRGKAPDSWPLLTKREVADRLLDTIRRHLATPADV